MTPLRLTTWFRKRMLPLVVASSVIVAAAAPIAYFVQKRAELLAGARTDAARVAEVVRVAIEERPRLWRYDAVKLGERLAAEGLDRLPLRVRAGSDADRDVRIELVHSPAPARAPLWGRQELILQHGPWSAAVNRAAHGEPAGTAPERVATVWVAADASPLYASTALLALVFTLLAAGLGTVLYTLPVRAIAGAERRAHRLLGQLALTLQEEDRRRIARDLHDGAGQAITAARLELLALAGAAPAQSEAARRIATHLDEALAEIRRSTVALGPPALAELGFARALARQCEAFADASGLRVSCEIAGALPPLGGEVELAGYRVVQEALTNVARHAGARSAAVRVEITGAKTTRALQIVVEDDGAGLGGQAESGGGLAGMRERARLLGGDLDLTPGASGAGLRLRVRFPLDPSFSDSSATEHRG